MSPAALGNHMYQGKIAANSVRLAAHPGWMNLAGSGVGSTAKMSPFWPSTTFLNQHPSVNWLSCSSSSNTRRHWCRWCNSSKNAWHCSRTGWWCSKPWWRSNNSMTSPSRRQRWQTMQGTRRRDFHSLFALLNDGTPQGGGLQLDGPPTVLSLCKMMRDQSMTPTTFHEYWLRTSDIPKGDRSVYEHECLSRILESMLTVDQINAPALQSAELLCRRMQVIREAHRISPGSPDYTSADVMMGWRYRRSGQGVVQELAAHVASELKNEAAIAKEARKAREEAENRRRNPKSKGKPSQEGGGGSQTWRADVPLLLLQGEWAFFMQQMGKTRVSKMASTAGICFHCRIWWFHP